MNIFDQASAGTPALKSVNGRTLAANFGDVSAEYSALREGAVLYDCGSYGLFSVRGAEAESFLETLLTKDVAFMNIGALSEGYFLNDEGEIVGIVFLAKRESDFLIITFWEFAEAVNAWMCAQSEGYRVEIEEISETFSLLSVEGCRSWKLVKEILNAEIENIGLQTFQETPFLGKEITVMRIGRTSEYGYMLLSDEESGKALYAAVLNYAKTAAFPVRECGLDCLELAMCEIHQPNFLRETKEFGDLFELNAQWHIRFDRENYHGFEAIRRIAAQSPEKSSVAFLAETKTAIPAKTPVLNEDGEVIGQVIYALFSYRMDTQIGLAMLQAPYGQSGLDLRLASEEGTAIHTVSSPIVRPTSWDLKME